jgi:histidyl-tRNA synthetase
MQPAEQCLNAGVRVELTMKGTGVAKQFKRADRLKARWAGVPGEGELPSGELKLKTMATGEERVVPLANLAGTLGSEV